MHQFARPGSLHLRRWWPGCERTRRERRRFQPRLTSWRQPRRSPAWPRCVCGC